MYDQVAVDTMEIEIVKPKKKEKQSKQPKESWRAKRKAKKNKAEANLYDEVNT